MVLTKIGCALRSNESCAFPRTVVTQNHYDAHPVWIALGIDEVYLHLDNFSEHVQRVNLSEQGQELHDIPPGLINKVPFEVRYEFITIYEVEE